MKRLLLIIILLFSMIFTTSCIHTPVSTQPPASEEPEDTLPVESAATNEITWDQSKYEVMLALTPNKGKRDAFELFPEYAYSKYYGKTVTEPVPGVMTVEVGGKSYTGKLYDLHDAWCYSLPTYEYGCADERCQTASFDIDSNGVLRNFYLYDYSLYDDTAPRISLGEATVKAEEYVEQLTGIDISNSSFKAEMSYVKLTDSYSIRFRRYVNGIKTSEYIDIEIFRDGTVDHYSNNVYSGFDDIDTSFIDMNEINSVFDDAIEYLYGSLRDRYDLYNLEQDTPTLAFLPDGTLAFDCRYSLYIKHKNAESWGKNYTYESNTIKILLRSNG